ncbi:hypothetical protein EDB92DRAFT_1815415 [Lactarius akahatsu]|uniref:Uncharacterized protein n=1 Tax=Lactarius akahatsu TaxID=416441 RepID=A0AAD4LHV5_9AGAM|nr:hypothetical protein EDB92DRAFT_1815415 [Lactarius akahatsu]
MPSRTDQKLTPLKLGKDVEHSQIRKCFAATIPYYTSCETGWFEDVKEAVHHLPSKNRTDPPNKQIIKNTVSKQKVPFLIPTQRIQGRGEEWGRGIGKTTVVNDRVEIHCSAAQIQGLYPACNSCSRQTLRVTGRTPLEKNRSRDGASRASEPPAVGVDGWGAGSGSGQEMTEGNKVCELLAKHECLSRSNQDRVRRRSSESGIGTFVYLPAGPTQRAVVREPDTGSPGPMGTWISWVGTSRRSRRPTEGKESGLPRSYALRDAITAQRGKLGPYHKPIGERTRERFCARDSEARAGEPNLGTVKLASRLPARVYNGNLEQHGWSVVTEEHGDAGRDTEWVYARPSEFRETSPYSDDVVGPQVE